MAVARGLRLPTARLLSRMPARGPVRTARISRRKRRPSTTIGQSTPTRPPMTPPCPNSSRTMPAAIPAPKRRTATLRRSWRPWPVQETSPDRGSASDSGELPETARRPAAWGSCRRSLRRRRSNARNRASERFRAMRKLPRMSSPRGTHERANRVFRAWFHRVRGSRVPIDGISASWNAGALPGRREAVLVGFRSLLTFSWPDRGAFSRCVRTRSREPRKPGQKVRRKLSNFSMNFLVARGFPSLCRTTCLNFLKSCSKARSSGVNKACLRDVFEAIMSIRSACELFPDWSKSSAIFREILQYSLGSIVEVMGNESQSGGQLFRLMLVIDIRVPTILQFVQNFPIGSVASAEIDRDSIEFLLGLLQRRFGRLIDRRISFRTGLGLLLRTRASFSPTGTSRGPVGG